MKRSRKQSLWYTILHQDPDKNDATNDETWRSKPPALWRAYHQHRHRRLDDNSRSILKDTPRVQGIHCALAAGVAVVAEASQVETFGANKIVAAPKDNILLDIASIMAATLITMTLVACLGLAFRTKTNHSTALEIVIRQKSHVCRKH